MKNTSDATAPFAAANGSALWAVVLTICHEHGIGHFIANTTRPYRVPHGDAKKAHNVLGTMRNKVVVADKATLMANGFDLCEEDFAEPLELPEPKSAPEPELIGEGICDACGRHVKQLQLINCAPVAGASICYPTCQTQNEKLSHTDHDVMNTQAILLPETPAEAESGGGVVLQRLVSRRSLKPHDNKFHKGNGEDGKHYWLTPPTLYAELDAQYHFDFDPCPYPKPADFDGLTCEWGKSNYANIPFGAVIHNGKKKGATAWVRKAIAEHKKGKRVVLVYPVDKWLLMILAAGATVRNLGDVKWHAIEDGSEGRGTGRHIACFVLEPPKVEPANESSSPTAADGNGGAERKHGS